MRWGQCTVQSFSSSVAQFVHDYKHNGLALKVIPPMISSSTVLGLVINLLTSALI